MLRSHHASIGQKLVSLLLAAALLISPEISYAQSAFVAYLPQPGVMVEPSTAFTPVLVKGLLVHPDKPLNFDLIVDSGNDSAEPSIIKEQTQRMAQYFLAAITVPEDQLWVNLSPYEKDRVIENDLGKTVLGRDMLAQDYILKQLTSSLIYPERGLGKEFWARIYAEAQTRFGTTDIPVDTFNKVWIMPAKAEVFEKDNAVYVTQARLKVMLDSDRTAMTQSTSEAVSDEKAALTKTVMREVILPAIEKEVNEGRNFAAIRQVYHAAILAKWYRELIQNTLLADAYMGKNRVTGVTSDEKTMKEEIYQRYIAAYKKGVFDYIKESTDAVTGEMTPRKYFSGGIEDFAMKTVPLTRTPDYAAATHPAGQTFKVDVLMEKPQNAAMSSSLLKIMVFGGSATAFYTTALGKGIEITRVLTPFDGGLTYAAGRLLSRIWDNPSSSGALRALADGGLPAPGDITKVIVQRTKRNYINTIMNARFTHDYIEISKERAEGSIESFEQALSLIFREYEKKTPRSTDPSNLRFQPDYASFKQSLIDLAREVDGKLSNNTIFDKATPAFPGDTRYFRHSVKNLILYAFYLKTHNWEDAIKQFADLVKVDRADLDKTLLSANSTGGLEPVAVLKNKKQLFGQEEITQHMVGQKSPVESIFLAKKALIDNWHRQRSGNKPLVNEVKSVKVKINKQLQDQITNFNVDNDGMIVFGPGSQFTSIIIHLMIPGVIKSLAQATNVPRVLMLNPIRDAETAGFTDQEYFDKITGIITGLVRKELGKDKDISDLFDFIVVNDVSLNSDKVKQKNQEDIVAWKARAWEPKGSSSRNKARAGLIKFKTETILKSLKLKGNGTDRKGMNNRITLVSGDLMEDDPDSTDGKNSFSVTKMQPLFEVINEYHQKSLKAGKDKESSRGITFISDPHASVDGALRIKLAYLDDSYVVVGDVSDRGHHLKELLRLVDHFTAGDHEFWAIAAAISGNPALRMLYLRMAFNYENDDLMRELHLEGIFEKVLEARGEIWNEKTPVDVKQAGEFFNYLFAKTYFEFYYKYYSGVTGVQKKDDVQRNEIVNKLTDIVYADLHKGMKGKGRFTLQGLSENYSKIINAEPEIPPPDISTREDEARFRANLRSNEGWRLLNKFIMMSLVHGDELKLLTPQEQSLIDTVSGLFQEQLNPAVDPSSELRQVISHFLKAPLYRVVKAEPQIPRPDGLQDIRIQDPNAEKKILLIHVFPVQNKDLDFVDMLGNRIPTGLEKNYYDRLNGAIEQVRTKFNDNTLVYEGPAREQLFAGFTVQGDPVTLPIDEWFLKMSDDINGPLMGREHKRIEEAFVGKFKEFGHTLYDLIYDNDIEGLSGQGLAALGLTLKDQTKNIELRDSIRSSRKALGTITIEADKKTALAKIAADEKAREVFLAQAKTLAIDRILGVFDADKMLVGHLKIKAGQVSRLANGKCTILDPEFATKGGATNLLDATEDGGGERITELGSDIFKLVPLRHIFSTETKFSNDIKKDNNFGNYNSQEYSIIESVRKKVLPRLRMADILYFKDTEVSFATLIAGDPDHGSVLFKELSEVIRWLTPDSRVKNWDDIRSWISTWLGKAARERTVELPKENGAEKAVLDKFLNMLPGNAVINKTVLEAFKYAVAAKERTPGQSPFYNSSAFREDAPNRYLLPVIIAHFDNDNNVVNFSIKDVSENRDIVISDNDIEKFLDEQGITSWNDRISQKITIHSANFKNGNISDEIPSDAAQNGGIDLQNIDIAHKSGRVKIKFNEDALRDVLKNGFNGFTPVIITITPVASVLPLLGLAAPVPEALALSFHERKVATTSSLAAEWQAREPEYDHV